MQNKVHLVNNPLRICDRSLHSLSYNNQNNSIGPGEDQVTLVKTFLIPAVLAGVAAAPAHSDGVESLAIYNNEVTAEISFVNGVSADVTIAFEQATGLDASSIGLSAELVDPTDPSLLARLPGTLVALSNAFPLRVSIEPPDQGTLSFLGVATVSIHTHNLGYSVGSPFRLFVAEDGGNFTDITDQAGSGSYRVRGSRGEFSEFMVVADLRSIDEVLAAKFDRLETALSVNQALVNGTLYAELSSAVAAARGAYAAGDEVGAIRELDAFNALVRTNAGGAIPNLWRSRDDIVNLEGELRSAASTLRYSLTLLANDLP